MVRTKEGGSVLTFVVVGTVLALLFVGAAYVVRQQTSPTEGLPQSQTEDPEDSKKNGSLSEEQEKERQRQRQPETKPDEKPEKPTPSTPEPEASDDRHLPRTGPAESVASLVALGSLAATVTAYLRSRRATS